MTSPSISWLMPGTMWGILGWNEKSFDKKIERCGGDEVRVVLERGVPDHEHQSA